MDVHQPIITKQENEKNPFLFFELLTLSFSILFIIIIVVLQILLEIFKEEIDEFDDKVQNELLIGKIFTAKKSMNLRRQWKLNINFVLTLSFFSGEAIYFL